MFIVQKDNTGPGKSTKACTQAMAAIGEVKVKQKLLEELIGKIKLRMAFNVLRHAAEASQHLASLVSHTVVSKNFMVMESVFDAWKQQLLDRRFREQQASQYSTLAQRMRFRAGDFPPCFRQFARVSVHETTCCSARLRPISLLLNT